jgi:hypothetical protein
VIFGRLSLTLELDGRTFTVARNPFPRENIRYTSASRAVSSSALQKDIARRIASKCNALSAPHQVRRSSSPFRAGKAVERV